MDVRVELLSTPQSRDVDELAALLAATVNGGAAVSFLPPLDEDRAAAWWREVLSEEKGPFVFVARDEHGIVGTVQLHRAWAPNQPHRGDVAKLMVHPRARRGGVAGALMAALEEQARVSALTLLTLDTRRGDSAEALYRKLGWREVGVIPNYAYNGDGSLHDTVIFFKELAPHVLPLSPERE